uniref:39S ribosomal protein L28, mitochondrial n=1 Tax=Steinernema glaseri TaxID=37863 RepID=A0A1I7Y8G1_9BILA
MAICISNLGRMDLHRSCVSRCLVGFGLCHQCFVRTFRSQPSVMSLVKNLKSLTTVAPRAVVTWDKCERIKRNEEIWGNPQSIVHRLPIHYQQRYWKNVLADASPVHYRPPSSCLYWDPNRKVEYDAETYPIIGFHPPEADTGLWAGETIVKGYIESRPYTKKKVLPRHWVPRFFFPYVKDVILYSEVLDKYFKVTATERACRKIDESFGLDLYLLTTPEIDVASKLAMTIKREILITLAKGDYYVDDEERHEYIRQKYEEHAIPLEEAEWVGLSLNEACRKQQDIEDSIRPTPLKYKFEAELVEKLRRGLDFVDTEKEFAPKRHESKFGDKLLGKYLNPVGKRLRA